MGTVEAENLQRSINDAILARGLAWLYIALDSGADVLDLTSCVDVKVQVGSASRPRDFAIRSYRSLGQMLHDEHLERCGPVGDLHYCVGGPLGIVNVISGSSIVSVVFHYLSQEYGGLQNLPPCEP